jgi:hypothetical protein
LVNNNPIPKSEISILKIDCENNAEIEIPKIEEEKEKVYVKTRQPNFMPPVERKKKIFVGKIQEILNKNNDYKSDYIKDLRLDKEKRTRIHTESMVTE